MNKQNKLSMRTFYVLAAIWASALLLNFLGCSSSTAPEGGGDDLTVSFRPTERGQQMTLAQSSEFAVSAPDAESVAVSWTRSTRVDPVGDSMVFNYVADQLGVDTLRVQVAADGVNSSYFWVITVESTGSTVPAAVPSITAEPGPAPGEVALSWIKSGSSTFPLAEYVVAVSFTGQISEADWDQARELRRVTNRVGVAGYQEIFNVADDGMIPGADAWFAVRAVDDVGQMSPIAHNGYTRVTRAWWLNGRVLDDLDDPVVGITVEATEQELSTNTDVDGLFGLGPFRDIDTVELQTISSNAPISGWFDYHSAELDSIAGKDYEILLIKRHVLEPTCELYGGQFLNYLRVLARTQNDSTDPENSRQFKWETYPVSVNIPDFVNSDGVDFGEAARFAMAFWDSVMGESYFVETEDQANANLDFRFDDSIPGFFGQVSLLKPAGSDVILGNVIPEKLQVYVSSILNTQKLAREISLHELGHALGLLAHTGCGESGYLMTAGASGVLERAHPIHPDEQRAVRCIRRMAQGIDMNGYSLNR